MGKTLTELEFATAARHFFDFSQRLLDDWELVEAPSNNVVYLKKLCKQQLNLSADFNATDTGCEELPLEDVSTDVPADNVQLYNCEYHIVYSTSYQVPVLYFNIYKSDGTMLTLEEAWKGFLEFSGESREQLRQTLTQMEHPVLFKPFLALHPCQTAQVLDNVSGSGNLIVAFVSSYGPCVSLNLDIRYGRLTDSTNFTTSESS
ncbi:ubiquitin-like-conjugating enzyme ATG10 [Sabethes cyaneus]|uniref:ubiquitin-like-conjugating enzyme ATG10 n=1 Tax=Sabethes cyaneus TaxID=53552 RepID=UPI00237E0CC9|nr:ubiquitin-like-conjugating enzyme ATG10 [Sabethes cyaneus]